MVKSYINKAGENVVIATMPNSYLLNATAKYKTNIEAIEKIVSNSPTLGMMVDIEFRRLKEIYDSLREEVTKRNLV